MAKKQGKRMARKKKVPTNVTSAAVGPIEETTAGDHVLKRARFKLSDLRLVESGEPWRKTLAVQPLEVGERVTFLRNSWFMTIVAVHEGDQTDSTVDSIECTWRDTAGNEHKMRFSAMALRRMRAS